MAKGLRSKVKKDHRVRLRAKVFQPVEDARTERLSAKLLELASSLGPTQTPEARMDLDNVMKDEKRSHLEQDKILMEDDSMQVDSINPSRSSQRHHSNRIEKKRRKTSSLPFLSNRKMGKSRRSKKK